MKIMLTDIVLDDITLRRLHALQARANNPSITLEHVILAMINDGLKVAETYIKAQEVKQAEVKPKSEEVGNNG